MPDLEILIKPSAKALAKILGGFKEFRDYRPMWRQLLPDLAKGLGQNVRSGGSTLGASWPEHAPSTERVRGSGPILIATGKMVRQLSAPSKAKRSLTKSKLAVGPKDKHAFVHHFGSEKRNIPARPFIGWSPAMMTQTIQAMDAFTRMRLAQLVERLDRAGGNS